MVGTFTRNFHHTATYWPPGSNDGTGGVSYDTPVLVTCRWQTGSKLFRDANGDQAVCSATVYVDRVVLNKGWMAPGDQRATANPKLIAEAREIRSVQLSPNLRNSIQLVKVML
jgi:hypothetical protein